MTNLDITIDADVQGTCLDEDDEGDPLTRLEINCVVEGTIGDSRHRCAWHLERDRRDDGDSPNPLAHPIYHLQFGGARVYDIEKHGGHLLIDPPRVAHPPLDGVLAVDFVLSNYIPDIWRRMRKEDGAYADLLWRSQRLWWRPYARSAAAPWNTDNGTGWSAEDIWPQLVGRSSL